MGNLSDLTNKLNLKTDMAYGLIRIFLGIALLIRGWMILSNPESLMELGVERESFIWVSLIGFAHLIGGALLGFGFLTRVGALIQIPILFSATFFVYSQTKLMMGGQSFELAALVLFLLCVYFVFGGGSFSGYQYFSDKGSKA